MLFNSFAFALFFPLVTIGYFLLPHRARWSWLLAASCYFYAAFVPAYLLILGALIAIDYCAALAIEPAEGRRRKAWLLASLTANLGMLAAFKYVGFFNANVAALARVLGWNYPLAALEWILPIGLSFHTFQAMSYTIEVYRRRQRPERHLAIFALYVMFYPQLVAGPIERPGHLLPQFREHHRFDPERARSGLQLMAWGLFKKVVVADRLAVIVDQVYGAPSSYPGPALVLATMLFAYQIYCDFSGYSDIALGAAEVMGFRLTPNFARPYSATSFADFWRRWHISLSSWFRDYCFFPFGFRRPKWQLRLHLLFVFILSGLWHGANWTFIVWGALHGFFRLAEESTHAARARVVEHVRLNSGIVYATVSRVAVFALVSFAWIFFRSTSMSDAMYIASHLFTGYGPLLDGGLGSLLADLNVTRGHLALVLMGLVVVEAVHLHQERYGSVREHVRRLPAFARWSLYHALVAIVMLFGVFNDSQFIYFQF